jgi:hypothetical protein
MGASVSNSVHARVKKHQHKEKGVTRLDLSVRSTLVARLRRFASSWSAHSSVWTKTKRVARNPKAHVANRDTDCAANDYTDPRQGPPMCHRLPPQCTSPTERSAGYRGFDGGQQYLWQHQTSGDTHPFTTADVARRNLRESAAASSAPTSSSACRRIAVFSLSVDRSTRTDGVSPHNARQRRHTRGTTVINVLLSTRVKICHKRSSGIVSNAAAACVTVVLAISPISCGDRLRSEPIAQAETTQRLKRTSLQRF